MLIKVVNKIAKKKETRSRDVSGESVQQGMLKLLAKKKEEPKEPEAPKAPEPSNEEKLLTEIRDLLKNQAK